MIEGSVNANYEAIITLLPQGSAGQMREIEAVVDTGYNGYLTLPPMLITELELPFQSEGQATLANGSVEFFDVYGVTALWDGRRRFIDADEADTTPPSVWRLWTAIACTWKSLTVGVSSYSRWSNYRQRLGSTAV